MDVLMADVKVAGSPVMDAAENIGDVIKRRREALGMAIYELAREAGVSRTTLYAIEEGRVQPQRSTRHKILAALGTVEDESSVTTVRSELGEVQTVEFTVAGDFGVTVTVKGPIEEHETLRDDVSAIIASIRAHRQDNDDPPVV